MKSLRLRSFSSPQRVRQLVPSAAASALLSATWTRHATSRLKYLPISMATSLLLVPATAPCSVVSRSSSKKLLETTRSEEHTSELQSRFDLVCRLLLEKKNKMA